MFLRALAATVLASAIIFPGAPAGAEGEFDAARRQANQVAAELADAQTRMAELEVEIASLEARAAESSARMEELEQIVRGQAVEQFMRNTSPPLPILVDDDLNQLARANALARFVTLDTQAAVDDYRKTGQDLQATRGSLEAKQEEAEAAVAEFRRRAQQANAELARLQRLEEERRAREEAARRARQEAERKEREAAERRAADEARAAAPERTASTPAPSASRRPSQVASAAAPRPAPRPTAPPPAPAPARPAASGGWVCPVQGPRAFSNDWGQPRSGGRRHQGNDILSPRGTPVVASVSGTVRGHNSSLGGISYYLKGDDGNTYFGTHLDSLSGASGRVAQGAVLGTVGDSGNARGGPTHLHFEIHPGGGAPVNPYPTLSQYC
ncbi:MAG: peptidoglycan DD-metalloendopeptidase family protein [Actinobacteria bacterium]|nr:peptidoglycan DD-metalloendopeptidase family protein [Actinomycetota bacterium]